MPVTYLAVCFFQVQNDGEARTFVDIREVSAETVDGFKNSSSVRSIQGLDGLGIQILNRLFITPANTVSGAGVTVKGVYGLRNAHLRGRHCSQRVEVAAGFPLQSVCCILHGSVSAFLYFVVSIIGLFDMTWDVGVSGCCSWSVVSVWVVRW